MKLGKAYSSPIFYVSIAFIIFFCVNIIGGLQLKRFGVDFTEDGLYSLSEGSYNIVEKSDEPIKLKLFFSNKIANGFPAIKAYASRVTALLEEYALASDGKIKLELIDPEPLSDDEDLAISYGLKAAPVDNKGNEVYFGLVVVNSVDDTRLIPIFHFQREKFIEYDISKIINDLSGVKKPKIGFLTDLSIDAPSMFGIPNIGGQKSWIILEQMRSLFEVVPVKSDVTQIDKTIDVLMVAQPKEISEDTLYAIDQFILAGGRAVMFLDPNPEGKNGNSEKDSIKFDNKISKLLNKWGVHIDPKFVIGDRKAARKVRSEDSETGNVDYVAWLSMRENNFNKDHQTTSILKSINFASSGIIEKVEGSDSKIDIMPLISSSENSMKIPVSKIQGKPDPKKILSQFISENKSYDLAVALSGIASSAFENKKDKENHISKSEKPINVILVADTDLMRDEVWATPQDFQGYRVVVPTADNSGFIINTLDFMGGSSDLISLRGRATANRPFTVVEELTRKAEQKYLDQEQLLKDNLAKTENKLAAIQRQSQNSGANAIFYQAKQQEEIKKFTNQLAKDKKELRKVQLSLREGIDKLGTKLKFINIGLVPLLIIIFAIFLSIHRARKRNLYRKMNETS